MDMHERIEHARRLFAERVAPRTLDSEETTRLSIQSWVDAEWIGRESERPWEHGRQVAAAGMIVSVVDSRRVHGDTIYFGYWERESGESRAVVTSSRVAFMVTDQTFEAWYRFCSLVNQDGARYAEEVRNASAE